MKNWKDLADTSSLEKTINSLKEKDYNVFVVKDSLGALEKIKEIIPQGASVMNGASITLEKIGYLDYLKSNPDKWNDLHTKINSENDPEKRKELRKEATLSDYYLGSVHAISEDGQMVIASNTGSQLPQIVFTSPNLIFVIGSQKITPSLDTAMKRLEEYVFPLENEHMKSLYGVGSNISKVLIFKKENPIIGRKINIILVKEELGF